ncbi:methyl-CpG-binding domain protein 5 [Amia ocellicauda]|uniref:methyl-CpG-binding domain protein 5 n=1 Tax=Amia ocellicauda TaxID=2972642 RepID=UPI0034647A91
MTGGSESGRGDKDGGTPTAHVPIGWQRTVDGGAVAYISPSGTVLSSGEEVRTYLLTDGTCKCGLECPLVVHKVFNFDPGAAVRPRSSQEVKAEEDMTKLCNHRRKVVAMAALCRSMEVSQLSLPTHTPGGAYNHLEPPVQLQCRPPQGSQSKVEPRTDIFPSLRAAERAGSGHGGGPLPSVREDGGHCTYTRQRLSSLPTPPASPSLATPGGGNPPGHPSLLFPSNGSLPRTNSRLSPELGKKGRIPSPARSPFSCFSGPAQTQRYSRPQTPQNRTPEPPSSPRLAPHGLDNHVSSALASLANSLGVRPVQQEVHYSGSALPPHLPSLSLSASFPPARAPHPLSSGSPSPFSNSLSPAGSLDAPSPQRSRHSSASSEHSVAYQGTPQPTAKPLSSRSPMPGGSPKFPGLPASPKSRLEGMLQQYKDSGSNCSTSINSTSGTNSSSSSSNASHHPYHQSNQSNFQMPPLPPFPPHSPSPTSERKNGPPATGSTVCISGSGSPGFLGLPLGQLLNQHQHQHHAASFPASSLLSAAAKAQLASQKSPSPSQNHSGGGSSNTNNCASKDVQSKVLISTLQSNLSNNRSPSALLLPHSPLAPAACPVSPRTPLVSQDKSSRRKRQRRSPTVLSMLKESQMISLRTAGADMPSASTEKAILSLSSSTASLPLTNPPPHLLPPASPALENHLPHQSLAPATQTPTHTPSPGFQGPREPQDPHRRTSTPGTTQPLSALLHLLSVQSSAQVPASTVPGAPSLSHLSSSAVHPGPGQTHSQGQSVCLSPVVSQSHPQYHSQGQSLAHSQTAYQSHPHASQSLSGPHNQQPSLSQPQTFVPGFEGSSPAPSPQAFPLISVSMNGDTGLCQGTTPDATLGPQSNPGHNLNPNPNTGIQDFNSHLLGLLGQLSSSSSSSSSSCAVSSGGSSSGTAVVTSVSPTPRSGTSDSMSTGASSNSSHSQHSNDTAGIPIALATQGSPTTKPPPATSPGPGPASNQGGLPSPLHLAESFPFMSQEQLLQLLSANSGLPSLLSPPFLGSLPLNLWMGGQQTQQQQQQQGLLNQSSQMNLLPSMLGPQGDMPVNLLGLLNPPPLSDQADKQGLQALLTASLLLGQHQAAMLPLAGLGNLNLELLLQQQQQFPPLQDGAAMSQALEKPSALDTLLSGPGALEALQGLSPVDGALQALQSLLLPAPPLPPSAFLSLSPALLAAALGSAETPAPQQHTQVTISSSSLSSTSVASTCTTMAPSTAGEGADALLPLGGPGKTSPLPPHLLAPLLGTGVLGDLSALGSSGLALSNLHTMLGAGPLLLPPMQASPLSMPLIQGQAAGLNPMACLINNLQLNMGPGLQMSGDKPIHASTQLSENTAPEDVPTNQLAPEPVPNPGHGPGPQQRSGQLDPYSSFMDTIYTSFLQVTGRKAEGGTCGGQSGALSALPSPPPYPQQHGDGTSLLPQNNGPPSLSPRRACTLRHQDLSRLGMEAAQSPARGTPKLSEDGSTPPPPGAVHKPGNGRGHCDPPVAPTFPATLEEAKTDSSACQYSNGVPAACAGGLGGASEEESERVQAQVPYAGPREAVNGVAVSPSAQHEDGLGAPSIQEVKGQAVRTGGARRGRKRKQTLQKLPGDLRETDTVSMADHRTAVAHQKLERSVKNKRRRVLR